MKATLPLDQMSIAEKLEAMEVLWEDLSQNGNIPSPEWHRKVLEEREKRLQLGEEQPIDWETAKSELRRRLS